MTVLERMWAWFDRDPNPPAWCAHPFCTRPATRTDPTDRARVCDEHVTVVRYQRGRPPRPLP